jgi:nucleoside-diphosphate-sugar epimerase
MRIAEMVEDLIGMCRVPVRIEVDPALLRPTDVPRQEADARKFAELTGWRPEIPWHTTLRDTLEYWRARILRPSPQLTPGP